MAVRDDNVIRGSLITSLILLFFSLGLNIYLFISGSHTAGDLAEAKERAKTLGENARVDGITMTRLKAMLGQGQLTQAELDGMADGSQSSDPEIAAIEKRFARDMAMFDASVEAGQRNYPALPEYLVTALRSRNEQLVSTQRAVEQIQADATADVANARKSQEIAEQNAKEANENKLEADRQYAQDRERINQEKEQTRDALTKTSRDFTNFQREAQTAQNQLKGDNERLMSTIDVQKRRINEMTNPQFELAEGEIRSVFRGGETVTINLGSADQLRPNVTFGVIDADEIRLQDAKVKANLQVTKIQGPHLAQARVIREPDTRSPIVPGDKVYSPFWSPGREVKIALAGEIDINDDGIADNDAIRGQITASGAKVVAELTADGAEKGELDSDVRFLVVGEEPEVSEVEGFGSDRADQALAAFGRFKARAGELGITIIPAWKLQAYLRTIDDSLRQPLTTGVRPEDFEVEDNRYLNRVQTDISSMYRNQRDRVQRGNEILSP